MKCSTQSRFSQKILGFAVGAILLLTTMPAFAVENKIEIQSVNLNGTAMTGSNFISIESGSAISASVTVRLQGNKNWHSTGWRINTNSGTYACVDTPDENDPGTYTHTFDVAAPANPNDYNVYFRAYDGDGCSSTSDNLTHNDGVTVTKANQTITFGTLADKTYGDADFEVSAVASSGLTVTFSSQTPGVCSVSDTTAHIASAGTCTVRASQSGNSIYNAAPDVDQSFTVNKADTTTSITNSVALATASYAGYPYTVQWSVSSGAGTPTGNVTVSGGSSCTDTVAAGQCDITSTEVGSKTLVASYEGDANFNGSTSDGVSHEVLDPTATLRVKKHVVTHDIDPVTFDKTADNFTINVTGNSPSQSSFAGSEDWTIVTLQPGAYSVDEEDPLGYAKSLSADCSGTMEPADTKDCTITNSDFPLTQAALTVRKTVANDNGGLLGVSDFVLYVTLNDDESDPTEVSDGVAEILDPNEYIVSEDQQDGYSQTSITGDCAEDGTITLEAGHAYTCTITNDDIAPSLTLVKHVDNGEGENVGTSTPSDFILTATGSREIEPTNISGLGGVESDDTFSADSYTLSETGPSGYTSGDGWSCTGVENDGDHITLGLGQSATCTITNTAQPGTLHIIKHVVNNDGADNTASDFSFTLTSGDSTSDPYNFVQDEEDSLLGTKDLTLNAGTYTVTETAAEHYAAAYDNCTNVFVPNGGEATCTITNNDTTGTIEGVKYGDQNGNGVRDEGETGLSGWTIYLDANDNGALDEEEASMTTGESGTYQFNDLSSGTYHVREVLKEGWTQTAPSESKYDVELAQGTVVSGKDFGNKENSAPEPEPTAAVHDVCPNLEDIQTSVPPPYSLINGNCIILDGGSGPAQGLFGGFSQGGSVLGASTTIEEQIHALQEQIKELKLRLTVAIMERIIELQKEIARLRALQSH